MSRRGRVGIAAGVAALLSVPAVLPAADAVTNQSSQQSPQGVSPHRQVNGTHHDSFGPAQRALAIHRAQAVAGNTRATLGLSKNQRLVVTDVVRDPNGALHVRYDRYYRGLPVIGGDFIVHRSPQGSIRGVDWDVKADLSGVRSVTPSVSADSALAAARRTTGLARSGEAPSLAVWAMGKLPRLAWKTVVKNASGSLNDVVYVDATTGRQIARWSQNETTDAVGTGHSLYSGDVSIHTNDTGATFQLRDLTRGNARTTDMNNGTTGNGTLFTDADNVWGNGLETSDQSAAADVHYGAAETWDFYKNTFGRNGIRNDGVGALSRVHFDVDYDNAFWNDDCFCMTYGDGDDFLPLVGLDVAGHEMSHGVTSNTAGLNYIGESGGLNEATSDIFGSSVEFAANNSEDPGDYYIGENIVPFDPFFLRRMDDPKLDAALYSDGSHSFNCYVPRIGRNDVHFSSGVANHFFYMLSEGTGSKTIGGLEHHSTTCNGTAINGIGRLKADKIWYRALNVYLTAGSNYQDARDATIRAARDVYGKNSVACKTVMKTWSGVKVKPQLWACSGKLSGGIGNGLKNGGFEAGAAHWNLSSGTLFDNADTEQLFGLTLARSGSKFVWLDGFGTPHTQHAQQTVKLPRARKLTLVYNLFVDGGATPDAGDTLKAQVKFGRQPFKTLATTRGSTWDDTYHRHAVNVSKYRGKRVTIRFLGKEDNGNQSGFFLDDIAITRG